MTVLSWSTAKSAQPSPPTAKPQGRRSLTDTRCVSEGSKEPPSGKRSWLRVDEAVEHESLVQALRENHKNVARAAVAIRVSRARVHRLLAANSIASKRGESRQ